MKKQTLIEKALAYLKGGDEAKMSRFGSKLDKYFEKQKKVKQDKIENLVDKISDAKEELTEVVLKVDLESINKTESTESYCETYVRKVKSKMDLIDQLQAEVDALKEDINQLNALEQTIYSVAEEAKV